VKIEIQGCNETIHLIVGRPYARKTLEKFILVVKYLANFDHVKGRVVNQKVIS
jgi:hypothetical protein